jgi:adenosylmethionine-8-amino-7-oxononanoate aminotransferase
MEGAYHGDTFGAMAVGERGLFTKPFHSKLFNVDFILSPGLNEPEKVIKEFRKLINKDDVVAFIFEPLVQGAGGMLMHSPEVLDELISLAKEKNILCIADEIMTGFGRTGKMFAADYLVHKPDIFCLSKGLTGGTLPMGITSCSESVAEKFKERSPDKTFYHGHSFTANPISCAAALASLKILLSEECQSRISEISFQHETFHKKAGEFTRLEKARSRGTIFAIDVKTQGSREYTNPVRKKIYDFFMKKNILLRPLGNTIYILPPYIISDDQLQTIYSAIEEFNVKMN